MHPKAVITFLVILMLGTGGWLFFKNRIGDVRPAVLPPSNEVIPSIDSSTTFEGESVDIPLQLPAGLKIFSFSKGLGAPRDLEFSQDQTLLVSIPSQGKVLALPDKNKDGKVDEVKTVLSDLDNPHGLAFYKQRLFVAEETRIVRYNWDPQTMNASLDKEILALPAGGRHFSRTIVFDNDGRMFVSLGSSCDVCIEKQPFLAAVIVSDENGSNPKVYSKGLRNAVFMQLNPKTNKVWVTEMGRDFLGDELPPDEINILAENADFGWPNCYGDKVVDKKFNSRLTDLDCANTTAPVFKIPAHSAPLGLTFVDSEKFPPEWQGDLLVSYHGSWNRSTPTGYKVVWMEVNDNTITKAEDFLTGFINGSKALGRPVDLIFDNSGNLFISDDKAGVVYVITK